MSPQIFLAMKPQYLSYNIQIPSLSSINKGKVQVSIILPIVHQGLAP